MVLASTNNVELASMKHVELVSMNNVVLANMNEVVLPSYKGPTVTITHLQLKGKYLCYIDTRY